ncbi:sugar ABC transporter permease [Caldicellulosiruptor changbaiensis]|uniref:Sugar ABC transporter permease n=1 Tax=Caldicellulosiruptor changbaiensis TaxID=1222016 RepID=A0A3T0D3X0_9FIRM|nr:sugar ABC transporter permease [Caldicellulosiruptor changbaiensis]AZT89839.1 sugar ABC transporter permease [Caldicellulosiruptor changbaiensis]
MSKITYKEPLKSRVDRIINSENIAGYVFILPWLVGFFVFTLIPIVATFYLSFTQYDLLSPPKFVGLRNYIQMFKEDPLFWKSMSVTFFYVFVTVPLKLAFALLLALWLSYKSKLTPFYRAIYYVPSMMGGSVAVAVLWQRLFTSDGVINSILKLFGINSNISWIGNPKTAIWTLILLAVWQFGSPMLIFLAGLKQIPESYYEAAIIDGANSWQKFIKITLPMLTPIIFFNLIMQMIGSFMTFTQGFIITNGGPVNSTLFYAIYLYRRAFQFYDMGYSCAMSWVMLIIIGILTAFIFKSSTFWVYYESKEGE